MPPDRAYAMGKMNTCILITGAGGFIGRHCVKVARKRGHKVIALVRSKASICDGWSGDPLINAIVVDLGLQADQDAVLKAVSQADVVIHAAAALTGGVEKQVRDTVVATQNLISAIVEVPRSQRKLVLVSSIAVYDVSSSKIMDEQTSQISATNNCGSYGTNKLEQEAIAMRAVSRGELDMWVMRPGAVFGPDRLWNGHLGQRFGTVLVRFGMQGQVPVSYIDNCALALVLAAEAPISGVEIINVYDDDLPDRTSYINALREAGMVRYVFPVSWRILLGLGAVLGLIPYIKKRLPGLLHPVRLRARMMPLEYNNKKLKERLGWQAEIFFDDAIQASIVLQNKGAE